MERGVTGCCWKAWRSPTPGAGVVRPDQAKGVVSRYAKPGYISHTTHDFGSILKFVEETFNLPSLGYADARADDLSDCFNFSQKPLRFQTIAAPLNAEHFLNDRRPPTDPDND